AELNDNVLALDVAVIAQSRPQRLDPTCRSRSGGETQEPDARDLRRLLRTRRERPCDGRAAEEGDEVTPPDHSITSSASAAIEAMFVYCRRGQTVSPLPVALVEGRRRAQPGTPDTLGARKAKVLHQVN